MKGRSHEGPRPTGPRGREPVAVGPQGRDEGSGYAVSEETEVAVAAALEPHEPLAGEIAARSGCGCAAKPPA
ncbi:hypothetical protein SSAG_03023 [Streptomyces sp. Mg1]|nr:hypothetical protein SSAG_03023 [Streptomyces sp. Mg1]